MTPTTELAPLPDGQAGRHRGHSPVAAVADHPPGVGDAREPSGDPDLDWIDSRVPMVHVPLRRPPGTVAPSRGPGQEAHGTSWELRG